MFLNGSGLDITMLSTWRRREFRVIYLCNHII